VTPTNIIKALPMTASATERIAAVATAPMSAGGLTESGEGSSDGAAKSDGTAGGQRGTEMAITTILPPGDGGQLNIAPYRKELLRRIARNWNPAGAVGDLTVLLRIARDGTLLDVELIQSSGKKKLDRQVLEAIRSTEFAPLPDAYKSSELRFKIDFSSVGIGWQ
jgi:TonB family protein